MLTPAARARVAAAYGALPTAFELNQGQTDPRVAFLARGAGATLFLTAHDAVLSLPPAPAAGQPALPKTAPASAACPTRPQSAHGLTGTPTRPQSAGGLPCDHADQPPTSADVPVWPGSRRPLPTVVRFGLLGTNPQAHVVGLDRLPGVVNYYLGNDRARWHTHVPTYAEVSYRAVYKGVDLVYHGRQGQLEYDFDVAPGADPSAIALLIEGGTAPRLDRAGNLVVGTSAGAQVLHEAPVAYQTVDGVRRAVAVRYVLQGGTAAGGYRVGFAVGHHDPRRPLVIDPVLYYATYLGGQYGGDPPYGLAVDSNGQAYVAGRVNSSDFPTKGPSSTYGGDPEDAYVSVFQPDGTQLAYSTYLGGSGDDGATGIAVDANAVNGVLRPDAYITGFTTSGGSNDPHGFPMRGNGYQQTNCSGCRSAFVAELQYDGTLIASTFLHSTSTSVSGNEGVSEAEAIALDSYYDGSVYVAGDTSSMNFPTSTNTFQGKNEERGTTGFVTQLSYDLTALDYSTYVGGCNGSLNSNTSECQAGNTPGSDYPTALTVRDSRDGKAVFLTGYTSSPTFHDNFAYHAQAHCSDTPHCYPGQGNDSKGYQPTYSDSNLGSEAFAAELILGNVNDYEDGSYFAMTYLGANSIGQGIASAGQYQNVFVTGSAFGSYGSYPLQNPTISAYDDNGSNAVLTVLDGRLSRLIYSTYLGDSNHATSGYDVVLDPVDHLPNSGGRGYAGRDCRVSYRAWAVRRSY